MSRLVLQIPSTLAAPRLGKAGPLEFIRNADGTSPLFAGYLHGTNAHLGAVSAGAPRTDLSGNGRTLTQIGSNAAGIGQSTIGFKGTGQVYLQAPFTGDDLEAGGEMAAFHFAFHPAAAAVLWGSRNTSTRRFSVQATQVYNSTNAVFDGASFQQGALENPIPAWRNTDYFMFGGSFSLPGKAMTMVRGHRGEVVLNGSPEFPAGILGIGGTGLIRMGERNLNSADGSEMVLSLFYNRAVTVAETVAIYTGGRALINERLGVDV